MRSVSEGWREDVLTVNYASAAKKMAQAAKQFEVYLASRQFWGANMMSFGLLMIGGLVVLAVVIIAVVVAVIAANGSNRPRD